MTVGERFDSVFQFHAAAAWTLHGWVPRQPPLDWRLLKRQAIAESDLDPNAVSAAGAEGLTQFMPATFAEWADRHAIEHPSPFNPDLAIQAQADYMDHLRDQFGGDDAKALAAYNWGPGHLRRALNLHGEDGWRDALPDETRRYVAKILTAVVG